MSRRPGRPAAESGLHQYGGRVPAPTLSRRRLLQAGAAGALVALGVRGGNSPALPGAAWKALASKLSGHLSRPGNPGYANDHQLYNPLFDGVHPAAIAFCASPTDVARCIGFARRHGLPLAIRGGRHSYGGYSTTNGLVVDVSTMSRVQVAGKGRAVVGAGAQLIDIYSGLAQHGVSIPAGSCATVGIAGLTLGGGIGVMDRLYGLTCDKLASLELVTAAGEVVRASAASHPDLFWACRGGGGGNFGVVTELTFETFPVSELSLFVLSWPWAAASQVLPAWMDWASRAPDEMWSTCQLTAGPRGLSPSLRVAGVWAGTPAGAGQELAHLSAAVGRHQPGSRYLGASGFELAMYVEAGCQGLSEAACHIAGQYPGGALPRTVEVAKSDIFDRPLGDAGVQAVIVGIEHRQAERAMGGVLFDSWGGAINRVAPSETAFVHRRAVASAQYIAMLPAIVGNGTVRSARSWLDEWYKALRPYASGEAYQNYIDPSLPNWAHAYYGENLPRLQEVKAKWDPDDVWHFAQSIPLPARNG